MYGECLAIPSVDTRQFGQDWDEELKREGCKIFQGSADGRAAFFVKLPKPETAEPSEGPREVYRPPPIPMHDPERRWNPVDDARLINLYESHKSIEEMVPHFPGRNFNSIKGRLQRLRMAGKIKGRYRKRGSRPGIPRKRDMSAPSTLSAPLITTTTPVPVTVKEPFPIRTTLTLNLNVNCADPAAVEAAIQVLKEVRRL